MPFPFYFLPESPTGTGTGAGNGNVVLKGFGGPLLLTGGYGGTPSTVDHRTLYAQSAARKANAATIDPKRTAAARK